MKDWEYAFMRLQRWQDTLAAKQFARQLRKTYEINSKILAEQKPETAISEAKRLHHE